MGSIIAILSTLIVVAIIAEVLAPKAQTANVITSFFSGFAGVLKAAVSPIA